MVSLLCAASLSLVTAAAVAADADPDDVSPRIAAAPAIPEPMVFDLVRGLHARAGEWEVNALAIAPIGRGPLEVHWAPEVEVAVADGLAFEVELPMRNEHIEALKLAAQGTFGTLVPGRLVHGAQFIFERVITETNGTELTPLYLIGGRFSSRLSAFGMLGARMTLGQGLAPSGVDDGDGAGLEPRSGGYEALQNANIFYDLSEVLVAGIEVNLAYQPPRNLEALITPQIHWSIGSILSWQVGPGLSYNEGRFSPVVATRIVASPH
jgi:hypothetical protein